MKQLGDCEAQLKIEDDAIKKYNSDAEEALSKVKALEKDINDLDKNRDGKLKQIKVAHYNHFSLSSNVK